MAKFYKIAKCVFSWPAQLKNGQIWQPWCSSREVTSGEMRKIGIHFIIYPWSGQLVWLGGLFEKAVHSEGPYLASRGSS